MQLASTPIRYLLGMLILAGVFGAWLVGQVCRDRFWLTALCFYIPSVLAGFLLMLIAVLAWCRSVPGIALIAAILSLGPWTWVIAIENRWSTSPAASEVSTLRLVHWNVFDGRNWSGVRTTLRDQRADIYVLSEVRTEKSLELLLADLGDDFTYQKFSNMAVLVRGRVSGQPEPMESGHARVFRVAFTVRDIGLSMLIVDLPSSLQVERDPLLRQLRERIIITQPDLIVGDFNAPRRSLVLSELPTGYSHAYEVAGSGWSYTWPVPVPLWAIDQCIVGPQIRALRYQLRSTTVSDHRLQVLTFEAKVADGP